MYKIVILIRILLSIVFITLLERKFLGDIQCRQRDAGVLTVISASSRCTRMSGDVLRTICDNSRDLSLH